MDRKRNQRGADGQTGVAVFIADQILSLIGDEGLVRGTHLSITRLATQFGVSRWPIEQALKALAERGLVIHRPRRGFVVGDHVEGRLDPAKRTDAVQEAYLAIADDLIQGRIERQVSESFVRERYRLTRGQAAALFARLGREGLVERGAGYGWAFSQVLTTPEGLWHTFQLRLMIEPTALLQKDYRLPPEEIARLRRVEDGLLSGGIERSSPDALFDRASQFHERIISGTRNPFLLETLRRVNRVRRLIIYQSMGDRERYFRQSEEHLALLDMIEEARFEAAAQFMHDHIVGVMVQLQGLGLLPAAKGGMPDLAGGTKSHTGVRPAPETTVGRSEGAT